jgi:hypothetical protein
MRNHAGVTLDLGHELDREEPPPRVEIALQGLRVVDEKGFSAAHVLYRPPVGRTGLAWHTSPSVGIPTGVNIREPCE